MNNIKITITGPGLLIDNEAYLIRDLLVSKGATVNVIGTDDGPDAPAWRDSVGTVITIEANGQVWGG